MTLDTRHTTHDILQYPIKTRLSLSGTLVVARDIAHAKLKEVLSSLSPSPLPSPSRLSPAARLVCVLRAIFRVRIESNLSSCVRLPVRAYVAAYVAAQASRCFLEARMLEGGGDLANKRRKRTRDARKSDTQHPPLTPTIRWAASGRRQGPA